LIDDRLSKRQLPNAKIQTMCQARPVELRV
jgi:hypothetical protein